MSAFDSGPDTLSVCCVYLPACAAAPLSHLPQQQLHASQVQVEDLQTMVEQTTAALVAAQARVKETHAGGHAHCHAAVGDATSAHQDSNGSNNGSRAALQAEVVALKVITCCGGCWSRSNVWVVGWHTQCNTQRHKQTTESALPLG